VTRRVTCRFHGDQRQTFVRKHIVETLHDRARRGFFWADGEGDGECAWCARCEDRRVAGGGEWTDALTDEMDIALLCGSCFDAAKRINGIDTEANHGRS
jgi:hypothetical protein